MKKSFFISAIIAFAFSMNFAYASQNSDTVYYEPNIVYSVALDSQLEKVPLPVTVEKSLTASASNINRKITENMKNNSGGLTYFDKPKYQVGWRS